MNTRETLAVADDNYFYTASKRIPMPIQADLVTLLPTIEHQGFTHVWLVPGTGLSRGCSEIQETMPVWDISATYSPDKTHYSYVSAHRPGQRNHIQIGFTEYSRWPWRGDDKPKTLYATIAYLEDATQLPVEWTPAHMSLEYIKRLNAGRWNWWQPMTTDLETKGFSYADDIAKPLHWPSKGQQMAIPAGATHLIRIDGNSAYAAAMIGLNIGEGNPEWTDHPANYDGKRPGFWHVKVFTQNTLFDGVQLPSFENRSWMTTDTIEQCKRSGMMIAIQGGWMWQKYHQGLRSTAEGLWKLRTEWRELVGKSAAHENVYETLRVVIKAIHGKMARPDTNEHFRRRDVWAADVSRSAAMTAYRIEKIYRDYGVLPVAIKDDELTYAVTDPHIFDSMLGTAKLGGFKLVECVEIQPVSKVD